MPDSPTVESQTRLFPEDECQPPSSPSSGPLPRRATSAKLILKATMLVMASLLLAALTLSCLPLLIIRGLMLKRLWDVLRFLLLTTSIGLGILNSGSRKTHGTRTETRAKDHNSVSSQVSFAGMFYGEVQPSYSNSFADREVDMSEDAVMSQSASMDEGGKHSVMSIKAEAFGIADKDDQNRAAVHTAENITGHVKAENEASMAAEGNKGSTASHVDAVCSQSSQVLDNDDDDDGTVDSSKERQVTLADHHELGLSDVMAALEQNTARKRGNVVHRRGSSLMEFPPKEQQEYCGGSKFANDDMVTHLCHNRRLPASANPSPSGKVPYLGLNDAGGKGHSASKKAPQSWGSISSSGKVPSNKASNVLVDVKAKESETSEVSQSTRNSNVDGDDSKVSITKQLPSSDPPTSRRTRHTRSRSELDMNELPAKQQQPFQRKQTRHSHFSRRRNVSLSCDLDKEFTEMGAFTSRLSALRSPPTPPFMMWAMDEERSNSSTGSDLCRKEGDGALGKAFSESLAPWREVTKTANQAAAQDAAAPVNVPTIASSSGRSSSLVREEGSPSRSMGSPSAGELNKKVDAFIARFHEQMRLQRLESMERRGL